MSAPHEDRWPQPGPDLTVSLDLWKAAQRDGTDSPAVLRALYDAVVALETRLVGSGSGAGTGAGGPVEDDVTDPSDPLAVD